jgi:hypothetical protein
MKMVFVDVVSDYTEQDSRSAIQAFKELLEKDFFIEIARNIKKYVIWCDCGSHFRNNYMIHFLFTELA